MGNTSTVRVIKELEQELKDIQNEFKLHSGVEISVSKASKIFWDRIKTKRVTDKGMFKL